MGIEEPEDLEFLQNTYLGCFVCLNDAARLLRTDKMDIYDYNAIVPALLDVMELCHKKITALGGETNMQICMDAVLDVLKLDEE